MLGTYPDEVRGGDDTVEIMSTMCNMTPAEGKLQNQHKLRKLTSIFE